MMKIKTKLLWIIVIAELLIIVGGLIYAASEKQSSSVLVIDMYGELFSTAHPEIYQGLFWEEKSKKVLVSATDIAAILEKYEKMSEVKAFILHIDANGGDSIAQAELAKQVRLTNKPIVAVISGSALSSGYYIAATTDRIFASELSNVADIGVMMSIDYMDKYGNLRQCQMSPSEFKRMYLDDCPGIDPRIYVQGQIDSASETRRTALEIAALRNISEQHAINVGDGTIYSGIGALRLGLIDEIGGIHEAVDWLETKLGAKLEIVYYSELEVNN